MKTETLVKVSMTVEKWFGLHSNRVSGVIIREFDETTNETLKLWSNVYGGGNGYRAEFDVDLFNHDRTFQVTKVTPLIS